MMRRFQGFVADGYSRARSAVEASVRDEVTADFADRLAAANVFTWARLRWQMSAEIRRRLDAKASPSACY
jgi:hypothetical protein